MSGFDRGLRFRAQLMPRFSFRPPLVRAFRWINQRMWLPASSGEVHVEQAMFDGMHACVFRPTTTPGARLPALIWFHGGGFVIGTPVQDAAMCARLAVELGITVVAPFYRLAPEHPFPAALDDAHAALRATHIHADALRVRPDRIAIGGASAGASLAAALALLARDVGGVRPIFQLLVYPMLDDRTVLRTDIDETYVRVWSAGSNRFAWGAYLGAEPGSSAVRTAAVPSRAESLADLPPAWIGVGEHDLFHDEDVAYARRLAASGVACELAVVPGAYHGFDAVSPSAPVSIRFREQQRDALRRALFREMASVPAERGAQRDAVQGERE